MENQHHLGVGVVSALPPHVLEDNHNRHHPQRVSRFSIQRLDTKDISSMMPRRRASVNHGPPSSNRSEFIASSYITMDDVDLRPSLAGNGSRSLSIRDHSKG